MGAEAVLSSQTSSLTAALTIITGATNVAVTNLQLLPRLGASQSIRIRFTVDGIADLEMQINLFDQAFDDFGLQGDQKRKRPNF